MHIGDVHTTVCVFFDLETRRRAGVYWHDAIVGFATRCPTKTLCDLVSSCVHNISCCTIYSSSVCARFGACAAGKWDQKMRMCRSEHSRCVHHGILQIASHPQQSVNHLFPFRLAGANVELDEKCIYKVYGHTGVPCVLPGSCWMCHVLETLDMPCRPDLRAGRCGTVGF